MRLRAPAAVLVAVTAVLPALAATGSASAARVDVRWAMTARHATVAPLAGPATLRLSGPWRSVTGRRGKAVSFAPSRQGTRRGMGTASRASVGNPGRRPFAVAATVRSRPLPRMSDYSPNLVQKGRFDDRGQWKMETRLHGGHPIASCRLKGTAGYGRVTDRRATPLDNGRWHTVTCWRIPGRYGITVDGVSTSRRGALGIIAGSRPITTGSKHPQAGISDQFRGAVDCIVVVTGSRSRQLAARRTPC